MGQASEWRLEFYYKLLEQQASDYTQPFQRSDILCRHNEKNYEPNHVSYGDNICPDIVIFCGLVYILFGVKDHITDLCVHKNK